MWKRKELKKNARRSIRQNYWRMVSVCFLIALLTASYPLATAFLGVHPLSHIDTISNLHQTFETETTSQILEETATTTAENFAFSRDLLTLRIYIKILLLLIPIFLWICMQTVPLLFLQS